MVFNVAGHLFNPAVHRTYMSDQDHAFFCHDIGPDIYSVRYAFVLFDKDLNFMREIDGTVVKCKHRFIIFRNIQIVNDC